MYEEYALVSDQIKMLTERKSELNGAIMKDMMARGTDKESHSIGKFTISKLKKWTYTAKTIKAEETLKATKAKEESTGEAVFIEQESLRFTPIKL